MKRQQHKKNLADDIVKGKRINIANVELDFSEGDVKITSPKKKKKKRKVKRILT